MTKIEQRCDISHVINQTILDLTYDEEFGKFEKIPAQEILDSVNDYLKNIEVDDNVYAVSADMEDLKLVADLMKMAGWIEGNMDEGYAVLDDVYCLMSDDDLMLMEWEVYETGEISQKYIDKLNRAAKKQMKKILRYEAHWKAEREYWEEYDRCEAYFEANPDATEEDYEEYKKNAGIA